MSRFCTFVAVLSVACCSQASWYWPFGANEAESKALPRVSKLVEPASLLMDEASDLADNGRIGEAIGKYREALVLLDKIATENAQRIKNPEFAGFRTKRLLVQGKIDSLSYEQVRRNAQPVVTTDTGELEGKLRRRRWEDRLRAVSTAGSAESARSAVSRALAQETNGVLYVAGCTRGAAVLLDRDDPVFAGRLLRQSVRRLAKDGMPTNAPDVLFLTNALASVRHSVREWEKANTNVTADASNAVSRAFAVTKDAAAALEKLMSSGKGANPGGGEPAEAATTRSNREQALADIRNGDFHAADLLIAAALEDNPVDVLWLNLKAVKEAQQGDFRAARSTLKPMLSGGLRNYHAHYNMALLTLKEDQTAKDAARYHYETGRAYGGPRDKALEEMLK